MKGFALETIFKFLIVFVAAIVAITLIIFYSDQIKSYLYSVTHGDQQFITERVESENFSTSQVRTYIMSCWDKFGKSGKNVICYALLGNVSSVDTSVLIDSLDPPNVVDVSRFNQSSNITIIKRVDNGVRVES